MPVHCSYDANAIKQPPAMAVGLKRLTEFMENVPLKDAILVPKSALTLYVPDGVTVDDTVSPYSIK
jgi:hypothetical protein